MYVLRRTPPLLAPSKLPFLLCSSLPLRQTSVLLTGDEQPALSYDYLRLSFSTGTRASSTQGEIDGTATRAKKESPKEQKRRGFNALIQWCSCHQDGNLGQLATSELMELDSSVLDWVQHNMVSLSCGQCLVVSSFLCEVLYQSRISAPQQRASSCTAEREKEEQSVSFLQDITDRRCRVISALIRKAASSEQLELQPFLILLSAIYGLYRVTADNPLLLSESTVSVLKPSNELWLALVHQTRAVAAAPDDTPQNRHDDDIMTEALLTVLLLFDSQRCSELLTDSDAELISSIAWKLQRLILPQLPSQLKSVNDTGTSEQSGIVPDVSLPSAAEDDPSLLDIADTEAAVIAAPASASGKRTASATAATAAVIAERELRMSMNTVRLILQNTRGMQTHLRLAIAEYLLLVLRSPTSFSHEDVAMLPRVFLTLQNIPGKQRVSFTSSVIQAMDIQNAETMAPLLPYVANVKEFTPLLQKCLSASGGGAGTGILPSETAVQLLQTSAMEFDWPIRTKLMLTALQSTPDAYSIVSSILAQEQKSSIAAESVSPGTCEENGSSSSGPLDNVHAAPLECRRSVFLSSAVCTVLKTLFFEELPCAAPSSQVYATSFHIGAALVQAIRWDLGPTTPPDPRTSEYLNADQDIYTSLCVYLLARRTFGFLTSPNFIDDRDLLNIYVRPLLLNSRRCIDDSLQVLSETATYLTERESRQKLIARLLRFNGTLSFASYFRFMRWLAPMATENQVFPLEQIAFILRQRTLDPNKIPQRFLRQVNYSKTYTILILRTLEYLLAFQEADSPATSYLTYVSNTATATCGTSTPSTTSTAGESPPPTTAEYPTLARQREVVKILLENYFNSLFSDKNKMEWHDSTATPVESAGDGGLAGLTAKTVGGESEEESGEVADLLPPLTVQAEFRCAVTEQDIEQLLTMCLIYGFRIPHRVLGDLVRRAREKMAIFPDDEGMVVAAATTDAIPSDTTSSSVAVPDRTEEIHEEATEEAQDREEAKDRPFNAVSSLIAALPLDVLPLPAHFTLIVRGDTSLHLPLTASYLSRLLRQCDLRIFNHVLLSFYTALRQHRGTSKMVHYMEVGKVAFSILLDRIEAESMLADATNQKLTPSVQSMLLRCFIILLLHVSQLPTHSEHLMTLVTHLQKESNKPRMPLARDASPAAVVEEKLDERWTVALPESLLEVHGQLALILLRLAAYLSPQQIKEVSLGHLQRLDLLFPNVANFVFLQVSSQLPHFNQRELLQVAAQYPKGAAVILGHLSRVDLRIAIDLNEFMLVAKRLPMSLVVPIVSAHLPYLTFAWTTRLLSSLAVRHEEVPLPLLRRLLDRLTEGKESASDADKSLLLIILQGYLLFDATTIEKQPSAAASTDYRGGDSQQATSGLKILPQKEDMKSWESLFLYPSVTLSPKKQQQRRELIRSCCDQLLSLEQIGTIDQLRNFLTSYPASLHQMMEVGVATKVETQLLPKLLEMQPIPLNDLSSMIQVLGEHEVLLSSTAEQLFRDFLDIQHLSDMRKGLLDSEAELQRSLTSCLRLAVALYATRSPLSTPSSTAPSPLSLTPSRPSETLVSEAFDIILTVFDTAAERFVALSFLAQHSAAATQDSPHSILLQRVARSLIAGLLRDAAVFNSSDFARLLQHISRMKAWDLLKDGSRASNCSDACETTTTVSIESLRPIFNTAFQRADAHSRCVVLKAIATDEDVFHAFETYTMSLIRDDVKVLSADDLELLLAAALQLRNEEVVEPLLDAIGTRLLGMMDQCRRSTLVRLLQCHAHFGIVDDQLLTAVVATLERQSTPELKLDIPQIVTLLQAISVLALPETPERLISLCFWRLEKSVDLLSMQQLLQIGQIILDLEMGYTSSVHVLVSQILESRDGSRGRRVFQEMVESLCDFYEIEAPVVLRATRLRKRRTRERVTAYWQLRRQIRASV